eukprot:6189399-Pleurochrysis_carterae.AAC.1
MTEATYKHQCLQALVTNGVHGRAERACAKETQCPLASRRSAVVRPRITPCIIQLGKRLPKAHGVQHLLRAVAKLVANKLLQQVL